MATWADVWSLPDDDPRKAEYIGREVGKVIETLGPSYCYILAITVLPNKLVIQARRSTTDWPPAAF